MCGSMFGICTTNLPPSAQVHGCFWQRALWPLKVLRHTTLLHALRLTAHIPLAAEATKRGEAVLDPFHPLGIVRRLRNKPVQRFEDSDQFLRMAIAEREGLLTVNMEVRALGYQAPHVGTPNLFLGTCADTQADCRCRTVTCKTPLSRT